MPTDTPSSSARRGIDELDTWPLVGREAELAALLGVVREGGTGAIIAGPRGAGRSRLLREVIAGADRDGASVTMVRATRSAATVPLGALLDLIAPGDLRSIDPAADGAVPLALMSAVRTSLADRAGDAPRVIGVDDADLLDPASAALLLALAAQRSVTVVAVVRTGRPCPDAILALTKDAGAMCVELAPLTDGECRRLIEAIVGGPVDRAAVRRAVEETAGDAVYLCELTRAAVASGALRENGGLWTIVREPAPNAALRQLVAGEMSLLDPAERELVELVAIGDRITPEEVNALDVEDVVASLEEKGMLTIGDGLVRVVRPLLARVVRGEVGHVRAQLLRERLLTAVREEDPAPQDDAEALRVARLWVDAGQVPALDLLLRASNGALRAGDLADAAEFAQAALDRGRSLPAALALARAHRLRGDGAAAESLLAAVEDLAPGHPDAGTYAGERLGVLFWDLRRPAEVGELLDRMSGWSRSAAWRAFVDRLRVTFGGGVAEGRGDIAVAERIATAEGVPYRTRRMNAAAYRLGLLVSGSGGQAARDGFEQLPRIEAGDDVEVAELATLVLVALESGVGWESLERFLEQVIDRASRVRVRAAAGIAALGLARLRLLRGQLHDASRWLVEAEVHLARRDPLNTMIVVRCATVAVAVEAGDWDGARLAHAALQSAVAVRPPLAPQRPAVLCATARLQSMRSPAGAAQKLIEDAAAVAVHAPGLAPTIAYEALRLGDPAATAAVLRLSAAVDAPLSAAVAAHAGARRAGDGYALVAAADAFATIGASRYAVGALAEAAETFLAVGRQDSARRAAARMRELHADAQGIAVPVVDGLDAIAVELTRRERQLVDLARRGLSNAEIADRLVLSVRTVETHLYRGMRKLGVRDRRDL